MQRLQPWQDCQFRSKIENAKNMRKTILQDYTIFSVFLFLFGTKIKNAKNMRKTIVQDYKICTVQKNRWKKHQIFEK